MKENEYVIINKVQIQKSIEELEKHYNEKANINDDQWCSIIAGQITGLKQILSQSTPLIPEIEKAYFEGECYGIGTDACIRKDDYISNLKLDI